MRLDRGERVLANANADQGPVVATTRALYLPLGDDELSPLPWERVDAARWQDGALELTADDGTQLAMPITEPRRLAEVVQERVTASIAVSQHVPLAIGGGTRGVRLSARRSPGGGAEEVTWQARYDAGLDPDDPATREQVVAALARLREQVGL